MNVRSRIISINLIEKIKLQPEYAKKIGIDLRFIKDSNQSNISKTSVKSQKKLAITAQ